MQIQVSTPWLQKWLLIQRAGLKWHDQKKIDSPWEKMLKIYINEISTKYRKSSCHFYWHEFQNWCQCKQCSGSTFHHTCNIAQSYYLIFLSAMSHTLSSDSCLVLSSLGAGHDHSKSFRKVKEYQIEQFSPELRELMVELIF